MRTEWKQCKTCIITQLMIVIFLAGCTAKSIAPSEQTLQTREIQPTSGKALVYFYYEKLSMKPTEVSLNGVTSEIKKDTYVVWEVSPGEYALTFTYNAGMLTEKVSLTVICQADQVYYFRMAGHDRDTHEIISADANAGQAKIAQYQAIGWFRDGTLVSNSVDTQVPTTPAEAVSTRSLVSGEPQLESQGQYYALIIGISQYQYFAPLLTAVQDAHSVAQLLQDDFGFQVHILTEQQATREGILDTLNEFRSSLAPEDKLLIYYAGRCIMDKETQTAYWLPFEAEQNNDTQWIMTDAITANLRRIPANQILIVADSCYADALTRARNADLQDEAKRARYLQKSLETPSRMLMLSGTTEPITADENQKHSIFAQAFLDALNTTEKTIFTTEELFFGTILEAVAGSSEYLPELKAIRNSGHQGGDFIFKKQWSK